tara:strand:+ start:544 stop:924 length:381 start_codon:yes stop_codon:yes gene_type:complete
MASAYHIVLCTDVTAPTGVTTYTAQETKTIPSTAVDFILVCTSENADVSVRLEHSADKVNWAEVKDVDKIVIQAEAVDLDVTAATSYMVYIDTPLLQYVRAKVGNATSATGDAIKTNVQLQYRTKK